LNQEDIRQCQVYLANECRLSAVNTRPRAQQGPLILGQQEMALFFDDVPAFAAVPMEAQPTDWLFPGRRVHRHLTPAFAPPRHATPQSRAFASKYRLSR